MTPSVTIGSPLSDSHFMSRNSHKRRAALTSPSLSRFALYVLAEIDTRRRRAEQSAQQWHKNMCPYGIVTSGPLSRCNSGSVGLPVCLGVQPLHTSVFVVVVPVRTALAFVRILSRSLCPFTQQTAFASCKGDARVGTQCACLRHSRLGLPGSARP